MVWELTPEKHKEYNKTFNQKNPDYNKNYCREYRKTHKAELRAKNSERASPGDCCKNGCKVLWYILVKHHLSNGTEVIFCPNCHMLWHWEHGWSVRGNKRKDVQRIPDKKKMRFRKLDTKKKMILKKLKREGEIMPKTRLTVKYINPQHGVDVDLDNEIKKAFYNLGFEWCGQGIDLDEPFERDIEFEKEQKI